MSQNLVIRVIATTRRACATAFLVLAVVAIASPALASPAVGEAAPDFTLAGSDGQTYTLRGLLADGDRGIVLAWFPKAFTPG